MQLPFSNLQLKYQNPQATAPLILPVQAVCNTPEEVIDDNIRINSRRAGKWLHASPAHDGVAILCGSGPSIRDDVDTIKELCSAGGTLIALNGAARFLHEQGLSPDYQIILDAQEQTADLVGPAKQHLIASQAHPRCFDHAPNAILWHLQVEGIDDLLPDYDEPFTLIGAASSVGTTALVVAYALGFRKLKCFGYDSSHKDGISHARHQAMNDGEPVCSVAFNGKDYRTSLTMKMQAERFPLIARLLEREGCTVEVMGKGLLPDLWNAPSEVLSEKEKYERMWSIPNYRAVAPGLDVVRMFLDIAQPANGATLIDFGCGTGRAALKLNQAGLNVLMVDFASNCRDPWALSLPFFEMDLSEPMALRAEYGFCTDVLEHIPPKQIDAVLDNIFASAPKVFFQIDTKPDICGAMINQDLHLTLLSHEEWIGLLSKYGTVECAERIEDHSIFYVERNAQ